MRDPEKIAAALMLAYGCGGIDGAHHKDWCIDQMVRALTGDGYAEWVAAFCDGVDGPNTFEWSVGIEP